VIPSKHLLRSMLIGTAVGVVMAIMGGLRSAHDAPAVYATQDYGNLVEMGAVVGCVTGLVHYATREWRTRVLREWYWASWIVSFTAGLGVGFFIPSVLPPPDKPIWLDAVLWLGAGILGGCGFDWVTERAFGRPTKR